MLSAVLLLLAAAELCLNVGEPWLSADVRHIRQIPEIIEVLRAEEPPRVLFLGNSLTRASIRPDIIADALDSADLPRISSGLVYPDDTTLVDWHYLYRTLIQPGNLQPDLVVISFAYGHLDDHQALDIERLGGEFAGFSSVAEAFAHDVLSLSDRIEYLLSSISRLWANRERVRTRILALIPGYAALAQDINRTLRAGGGQHDVPGPSATYRRLARFLGVATKDGNKVVFVAIPVPRRYPLSRELRDTIRNGGAELIDLQDVPFEPADFPDGYHLSDPAAQKLSKALAGAMADSDYVRSALR